MVGNRLLSGEKSIIACNNSNINATDMQVGCQENKSDPGFARYMMNPVKATDIICTTMLIQLWLIKIMFTNVKQTGSICVCNGSCSKPNVITSENLSITVFCQCMKHGLS